MSAPLALTGHGHGAAGAVDAWALVEGAALAAVAVAAALYAVGLWRSRRRSPWPVGRTACWFAGLVCVALAVGPIARAAHESFTAHMVGHLLLGMLAPLLLVLGAPVTLALRALPVDDARALSRLLRSRVVRWLTHPIVAALLNAGGLWLLYSTELFALMHGSALVHAAVHVHILLAGYVLTASLVGRDPDPHRASLPMRAGVLIAFIAVHSALAKRLFRHPPADVSPPDAQIGSQVMYYGGDVVDVALLVLLGWGWFTATRPRRGAVPVAATT
ncbi:MAG: cytochrome c oxidase assembly protein [Actinomycetota bacterium]